MGDDNITRVNTADELERYLLETEWDYLSASVGTGPETQTARVCPFCNALVPPRRAESPLDYRRHHIRYHVDIWRQIDRVREQSWP